MAKKAPSAKPGTSPAVSPKTAPQRVPKPTLKTPPSPAMYAAKVAALRARAGNKSVTVDLEGRIVVEVDAADLSPERAAMFRRVWGAEWPTVRSDKWMSNNPSHPDHQLRFYGRGY